jgi:hypothetical protein
MGGKTKFSELYIAEDNIITSNEKNVKYFDEGLNDIQDWGERGNIYKVDQHTHYIRAFYNKI